MPRRLSLGIAAAALVASLPSVATSIEVQLTSRGPGFPLEGEVVVRAEAVPEQVAVYPMAERLHLDPVPEGASVTCRGDGLWCPEIDLDGDRVTLPVFVAMTVTGSVEGRGVVEEVASGTVQGLVQGEAEPGTIEFHEPVAVRDGRFAVTVPRATLGLRFAFPGAAPIYRWNVEPPEGRGGSATVDLGRLALEAGGSLSGWVRRRDDELPVEDATVVARPVTDDEIEEPPLRRWEASTGENGFFQVHGLGPGTYRLEVSARDLLTQVVEPVEVESASETLIGSVLLVSPFRISIGLTPRVDPDDRPWRVVLRAVDPLAGEGPIQVTAGEDGTAEAEGLRPADYWVEVRSSDDDRLLAERHHLATEGWLSLDVPVMAVVGRVRFGGEPIAATVALATGNADHVQLESDRDGNLTGWMRRPTRPWVLATVSWSEGDERRQRELELSPSIDDDVVRLDVDLPAGSIHGEVVDSEGRPQRDLRVIATPARGASRLTRIRGETDRNGRFRLTGLDRTEYLVRAGGKGRAASEVVRVDLGGDLPVGELRLVVWPVRRVEGRLTVGGQDVAGASIRLEGVGPVPASLTAATDAQGTFGFDVPESLRRAVVTVSAPSHLLWSGCLPVEGDRLPLALPALEPAILTVSLVSRDDLPPVIGGQTVLLTGEGGFVTYNALAYWNRLRNGARRLEHDGVRTVSTLSLPAVAPTSYALTWSDAPAWEIAARSCAGVFGEVDDWVTAGLGGEAVLGFDLTDLQKRTTEDKGLAGR